jgi:putative DNA primase/helicase
MLSDSIANERPILIVKGQAAANRLAQWNIAAACNGAKWNPKNLRGADIVVVPNDVGWEHLNVIGASLDGIAKRVRVLVLPGLPDKGDIEDWAKAGGTPEQLRELIDRAPDWIPQSEKLDDLEKEFEKEKKVAAAKSEDELLDALAKMPKGIARGRERKRLAKQFDVNTSDIDAEIEARQAEAEDKALLHGHWFVVPWPEPADGDALIRDIINKIHKHVVCSYECALAVALWIMLAWVHDEVATHSPILDATSAEPASGKTTLLGVLSFLVPRGISSVDISKAALYRAIQRWQPSFVVDEFDDVLAAQADSDKSELRSVINSGHTRGQGVLRCITNNHQPELFLTFCPKAIGMVGKKMPPTTLGRCIVIELRRRKKAEQITKFRHDDDSELGDLRSRLRRWSMDNVEALRNVAPAMPDTFDNRLEDNWRLQFAIADLCSGVEDWGDKARAAAVKVEKASDSRTVTTRLLAAIKAVFDSIRDEKNDDAIGSQELCDRLAADPESECAEWGKSRKPITQNALARMLKDHAMGASGDDKIRPDQVRPKTLGGRQIRGYQRSWFEDAWARYL